MGPYVLPQSFDLCSTVFWKLFVCINESIAKVISPTLGKQSLFFLGFFFSILFDDKGSFYAEEESWLIENSRNVGAAAVHHHSPRVQTPV